MKQKFLFIIVIFSVIFISCRNSDIEFPDYDYSAVYFAYQYPVRTLIMGEDEFIDTSLDNEHKCKINATIGGVYSNKKNVVIDYVVDEKLCDNLYFVGDDASLKPIKPLPNEYYSLSDERIELNNTMMDGVEVSFTDDFFNLVPDALENTYVIPLRITDVTNADSILSGKPNTDNPVLTNSLNWDVQPQNFILYCVKYINKWAGNYIRIGKDKIKVGEEEYENVRIPELVEDGEICNLKTVAYLKNELPVTINTEQTGKLDFTILLEFDNEGKCEIFTETSDYQITGTGKFISKGEKNSWGNKDRDALYLDYTVKYNNYEITTSDTLIMRDRGVKPETFKVQYKENE